MESNTSINFKFRLKSTLSAFCLLVVLPFSLTTQAAPEDEAAAVFGSFLSSLTNVELDNVLSLFSEDALFWGTGSQTLVEDTESIRQYFSSLSEQTPGQNVASAIQYSTNVVSEDLVLISGMWQVAPAGAQTTTPLRVSMAIALRNGQWKIIQFHNSNVP